MTGNGAQRYSPGALELGAQVVAEAHTNELAGQIELELRDPDGYFITVCYREKPMLS